VRCTAPTGVAALLCGGSTLHSVAGCGLGQTVLEFQKMWTNDKRKTWRDMQTLIIDEVSMVEPSFLDFLDAQVREMRQENKKKDGESAKKKQRPFGGIQLIFCGDFCQLPGITGGKDGISLNSDSRLPKGHRFKEDNIPVGLVKECHALSFQTACWKEAGLEYYELTTVHRQKDKPFVDFLMKVRGGYQRLSASEDAFAASLRRPLPHSDVVPTKLFAVNRDVEVINNRELARLDGETYIFKAMDSQEPLDPESKWQRTTLKNSLFFSKNPVAETEVELKVDAQVMLTKNETKEDGGHLVNGSRGVVRRFEPSEDVLQELAAEEARVDLECKEYCETGQRDPEVLQAFREKRQALEQRQEAIKGNKANKFPVVWFEAEQREKRIEPEVFQHEVFMVGKCTRLQVPLKLAWALTIHKSQGATIDKVIVHLGDCFEDGQAYVALSRARSPEGLQVEGYCRERITARPLAVAFHDKLSSGQDDVADFVAKARPWWMPLVNAGTEAAVQWRKLFELYEPFREWVRLHK